jgi:hypothetical protein
VSGGRHIPGYWRNETSGVLQPAVVAYLNGTPLDDRQIAALRAYLRQWIAGDFKGSMIDVLRSSVEEITTRADIELWLSRADVLGIDPL